MDLICVTVHQAPEAESTQYHCQECGIGLLHTGHEYAFWTTLVHAQTGIHIHTQRDGWIQTQWHECRNIP